MSDVILSVSPQNFMWETADPFLFCVHHNDAYPAGNEAMGPNASLAGRRLGEDFAGIDGWRMYHGDVVPGFPQHPHRGFETLTLVRRGLIDHSDSLGASARFGQGDAQWLTAGSGVVHSEMFPLLQRDKPNPVELFQIWINLPKVDKMADAHFTMLWSHTIPTVETRDRNGKLARVTVIAGQFADAKAPTPPPRSWASRDDSDFAVWTIDLEAGATFTLPPALATSTRNLYAFAGATVRIAGRDVATPARVHLRADAAVDIVAGPNGAELLLLQARPISEPVAQHGPFVMNTTAEIQQAFADYRRTGFGGWPWPKDAPVHPREETRFARHANGRIERGQ